MLKRELKEEIFELLRKNRLLRKQPVYDDKIINSYYAEVLNYKMLINYKFTSLEFLNFEWMNTIPKWNLEDIYNELKNE